MPFMITTDQMQNIVTSLRSSSGLEYIEEINTAAAEVGIDTAPRMAMFVAQCAHESADFTRFQENLNYGADGLLATFPSHFPAGSDLTHYARNPQAIANRVYANRLGNGDEASGDGWRYRGRGAIQLTGKSNYSAFGAATSIDAIGDPDLLLQPDVIFRVAAWFWNANSLNSKADLKDIIGSTRIINGGYNGLADRKAIYQICCAALGVAA